MSGPSRLQEQLADAVLEYARDAGMTTGAHLPEPVLCERFKVSRTPVRAALSLLARRGYVRHVPRKGYFLARKPRGDRTAGTARSDEERLYLAIAEDRISRRLPDHVSEADLLRRYGVTRSLLGRVLQRLLHEGLVERRPGRGWMFAPVLDSQQAHDESYRFRIALEPLALLEPMFALDEAAAARSEEKHRAIVEGRVRAITPVELFEMNAEFHEIIAAGAQNRFFLQAVQQQNRLRRFVNYHWIYGPERALRTCREHLVVLAAIRAGDRVWAATLLRQHLESTGRVSPYEEGTSAPERLIRFD